MNAKTSNKGRQRSLSVEIQIFLLLSLTLTVIPHVVRIPTWMTLFVCLAMLFKLATLYYPKLSLPKPVIITLGFFVLAGVALHYATILGRDSGVCLLIGMLFIKLLETRQYRDAMVLIGLSYFVILTNLLYTQSIPTTVYMLLLVFTITLVLVTVNSNSSQISWPERLRIVLPLSLFTIPLALLLFILFPRIPGPIWALPHDVYTARTGMNDTMSPGTFSELALSDEVAFRVRFNERIPSQRLMYWRALVLWDYDGRTWRAGNKRWVYYPKPETKTFGAPIDYTVTIEPHQKRWLYALDIPVLNANSRAPTGLKLLLNPDGGLRASNAIVTLSRYQISSYPRYVLNPLLGNIDYQRALRLPNTNPQTSELAKSWRGDNLNPEQIIDKALTLFRNEFTYTLSPPLLGKHMVDEFLFQTKRGFCEHFAGAFAVLMRASGIPARIVIGYQGGEYNPRGNYWLVRQADAHAWAEVWLKNRGWVRVDPTNAVSPARIESGLDQAIPLKDNPRFLFRYNSQLIAELGLLWDSVNAGWNEWILGYGPEMQKFLLAYLGIKNASAFHLVFILTAGLAIVLVIIFIFSAKMRQKSESDHVQRIYLKLCKKLSKAGYARKPSVGAQSYLQNIQRQNSELGIKLSPILDHYIELRYRQKLDQTETLKQFRDAVRQLKLISSSSDASRVKQGTNSRNE